MHNADQKNQVLEDRCRDIIEDAIALGSAVAISTEEYFGRKDRLVQRCIDLVQAAAANGGADNA